MLSSPNATIWIRHRRKRRTSPLSIRPSWLASSKPLGLVSPRGLPKRRMIIWHSWSLKTQPSNTPSSRRLCGRRRCSSTETSRFREDPLRLKLCQEVSVVTTKRMVKARIEVTATMHAASPASSKQPSSPRPDKLSSSLFLKSLCSGLHRQAITPLMTIMACWKSSTAILRGQSLATSHSGATSSFIRSLERFGCRRKEGGRGARNRSPLPFHFSISP